MIELLNVVACVAVIVKIARRKRAAGRADTGMTRLVDDLVLLLAKYHLVYDIVFGVGVYVAFLLPYDSPMGSSAMQLVRATRTVDCSIGWLIDRPSSESYTH